MSQTKGASAPPPFLVTLADGRKVDPVTGKVAGAPASDSSSSCGDGPRIAVRRTLSELPTTQPVIKTVAVVAALTAWGLQPGDVAELLGTDEARVVTLLNDPTYQTFIKMMVRSVLDSEQAEVRDGFVAVARNAQRKVLEMLDDDDVDPKISLKAAQDILDRSGLRAADIVEHRHTIAGGLKIIYEKRGEIVDAVKDIQFEEVKNGHGS